MTAVSFLSTVIGGALGDVITRFITPSMANLIGAAVIVAVGVFVVVQNLMKHKDAVEEATLVEALSQESGKPLRFLGLLELLIVAVAQAINDFAVGFYAGVSHIPILLIAFTVGFFCFWMFYGAIWLGRHVVADRLGDRAALMAGILLIAVGLFEAI